MSRTLAIFTAVTKNWLRSRSGLFFSLLFPLMLLLVFGAVFGGGGSGTYNIQIQNKDLKPDGSPTTISSAFVQALNQTKALSISPIPASADPKSYVKNTTGFFGGRQRILIVSPGFEQNLLNGTARERLSVTFSTLKDLLKRFGPTIPPDQKQGIQQGLTNLNGTLSQFSASNASLTYYSEADDVGGQVVKGIISSVANSFNYRLIGAQPLITFSDQPIAARGLHPVDYYLPGITAAFIMTNGVIGLTSIASEFRRRGILKRLSATPLSRLNWIIGNVLSQTVLAVALTAVMIAVGFAVFGVTVRVDVYSVALIVAGAILFAGMGMLLAGVIKDSEAATGLGNAIAFPMMFLSGVYIPLDAAPHYVQAISKVLPLTYFSDGLRAALILQDYQTATANLIITSILAVIFIVVGSTVTRWKEK